MVLVGNLAGSAAGVGQQYCVTAAMVGGIETATDIRHYILSFAYAEKLIGQHRSVVICPSPSKRVRLLFGSDPNYLTADQERIPLVAFQHEAAVIPVVEEVDDSTRASHPDPSFKVCAAV